METTVRAHVLVQGRVQGVAYRAFTYHEAIHQGLNGWVRNLQDGRVELEVEGDRTKVDSFLERLKKGPPLARVDDLEIQWMEPDLRGEGFDVRY